ncbi:uncharacterized protein G2W53_019013 [Senna tora]|uniref:Uncharacterized protein n=1 Tax=Senna tora TaxID=362788 RepID=A0A834U1J0_9FABA|nr:uncharacterized protein G2W53_019013 [Senna tora]
MGNISRSGRRVQNESLDGEYTSGLAFYGTNRGKESHGSASHACPTPRMNGMNERFQALGCQIRDMAYQPMGLAHSRNN